MTAPNENRVFRVTLRMEIHPGMEADFEQAWLAVGDAITTQPANLGQWLSCGADGAEGEGECVYYIVSDWLNEPLFREFEHSDVHLEHRKKLHPFRSSGSITTMHLVAHLPGVATAAKGA